MGAESGIKMGVAIIGAVMLATAIMLIVNQSMGLINKGLSQSADLVSSFDDIDKQKYDGMTVLGSDVVTVISQYWDDPSCEIVVCTLDGINAVYNKESTDGTYSVPFNEIFSGMPTADCKGRLFPSDATISDVSALTSYQSSVSNTDTQGGPLRGITYDVSKIASHNITDSTASGNAVIVDAAALIQNPGGTNLILATPNGYNNMAPIGSGGYISSSSAFTGSVQKDANGSIRRITFVQR